MKKLLVGLVVVSLVLSVFVGFNSISFAQKKYKEAPMLAELVKAGKLPPVEERLPKNPFVVGPGVLVTKKDLPDWKVGKYGGTLRILHFMGEWDADVFCALREPLLSAPGIGTAGVRGNIVDKFDVSKDNKVFTFHLREGLKWSDGEPVTTEDISFTYEDVLLNEKLTPIFPARFRVGNSPNGEPMKLEVLDKYTFRITFPKPYGGFLRILTIEGWSVYSDLLKPAHYLKQFHIKYTPMEKLKPLLEKEGLKDEWWQLFNQKDFSNWELTQRASIGFPVLTPWRLVKAERGVYEYERNPYYFKVDTQGNQLPYIDKIISTEVQDAEMANIKAISGEVDFFYQPASLAKIGVYKQNEQKGGYRTVLLDNHGGRALDFNYTYNDPVWRKIVEDVRFRKAIDLAINRKEVVDSIYLGFVTPIEKVEMPHEYDVARANELLDKIGLSKRDSEGIRLRPDGKPFVIIMEIGKFGPEFTQISELIVDYLKAVGIKVILKAIDTSLWSQRNSANELQATLFITDWNSDNRLTSYFAGVCAPEWDRWMTTGGKAGIEPPAWVKEAYELDKKRWETVPNSDEYKKLWAKGVAWHKKYLPNFVIVDITGQPVLVSARLGNIPSSGFAIGANFSAEQFFYEK